MKKFSDSLIQFYLEDGISGIFDESNSLEENETDYQVLALLRPNKIQSINGKMNWLWPEPEYKSVLLVYNCKTEEGKYIPVKIIGESKNGHENMSKLKQFTYKISGDNLMITQTKNYQVEGDKIVYHRRDIMLYKTDGRLIHTWSMDDDVNDFVIIKKFYPLNDDHWIIYFNVSKMNLVINKYRVLLLPTYEVIAKRLFVVDSFKDTGGSLYDINNDDLKYWFSSKDERGAPYYFVLAGASQCCIYRLDPMHHDIYYDKITDFTVGKCCIDEIEVVLTEEYISVRYSSSIERNCLIKNGEFKISLK